MKSHHFILNGVEVTRHWRAILHFFLTSRPYSYVDNAARALWICAIAGLSDDHYLIGKTLILSLLMWCFLNWYSDGRQRDRGRIIPPRWLVWAPLFVAAVIASTQGLWPLAFLLGYVCTVVIYPLKALLPKMGITGPLLRGGTVLTHAFFILKFIRPDNLDTHIFIVILLALTIFHLAKNLVGDIRDIRTDRYELPARYGFGIAIWILRLLFVSTAALTVLLPPVHRIPITTLLLFQWSITEVLTFVCGKNAPHLVGYLGHRLFVLTFTSLEIILAYQFGAPASVCLALSTAMLILQASYRHTPGKDYPTISSALHNLWNKHPTPKNSKCGPCKFFEGKTGNIETNFMF